MKRYAFTTLAALAFPLSACKPQPAETPADPSAPAAAQADPADDQTYVGMEEKAAGDLADKAGITWRVIEVDGEPRPATMDHRPDRMNFAVAAGKVIRVTRG